MYLCINLLCLVLRWSMPGCITLRSGNIVCHDIASVMLFTSIQFWMPVQPLTVCAFAGYQFAACKADGNCYIRAVFMAIYGREPTADEIMNIKMDVSAYWYRYFHGYKSYCYFVWWSSNDITCISFLSYISYIYHIV